jgi:hypothetical protein
MRSCVAGLGGRLGYAVGVGEGVGRTVAVVHELITSAARRYEARLPGIAVHYEAMIQSVDEKLRAEADQCHRWSDGPGAVYAIHSHPYRPKLHSDSTGRMRRPAASLAKLQLEQSRGVLAQDLHLGLRLE